MFYFFLLFLKELFYFFYFFFYFFIKNLIAWGGQDFLNFWEIQISKKKIQVQFFFAFFLVTTLWLQGDSRAKWTYRFFKKSWPLFWRSHSFLRKSTYLFTDIFKDNLDIVEDNRKKSQFSNLEIIISVFFISITIRCTTA